MVKIGEKGHTGTLVSLLVSLVKGYQLFVSPLLPGVCRYQPSCSRYAVKALKAHGALKGISLSVGRVIRCRPFGGFGYDPVPGAEEERTE